MRRIALLMLLLATMAIAGCESDNNVNNMPTPPEEEKPEDGNNTPETQSFDVDITATTRTTVTFNITPADLTADYFCYIVERATADEFARDTYLINNIIQEVEYEASNKGLTFVEYMAEATDKGAITDVRFSGLTPATEYYIVLFGVDATKGYIASTKPTKVAFTTATVEMSECTFEVTTTIENNNVKFSVTPSIAGHLWHLFTLTRQEYDYYTDEASGMSPSAYFEWHLQRDINNLRNQGYSDDNIIKALIFEGALELEAKGLNANTEHCYLIAGLHLDGEGLVINTPVTLGDYTTGDVVKSEMTFEIKVWDIEQLAASFSITPSNDRDKYCALVQPWDGISTADEVMHQIVDQWGGWMATMANDRGHVEHSGTNKFKLPAADTEYYIIAFGYDGGITTDATMATFRTLPGGSIDEASFTMQGTSATPYTFKIHITSSDPTIYYVPGVCAKGEYVEEEFVAMEEDTFNYFLTEYRKFNPSITYAELLDQYYYNSNNTLEVEGLVPDTEYMGYIYIFDTHTGKVVHTITFDNIAHTVALGDIAPSIELVGYYSGDEEAGRVFKNASATAGKAIVVVRFTDLENVRTLFTTYVEGDCSNDIAYPNSEVWKLTQGYWSTCQLAKPYIFFTATWNEVHTALCYAVDKQGVMGAISRLYTQPTAAEKRPIEELIELAATLE